MKLKKKIVFLAFLAFLAGQFIGLPGQCQENFQPKSLQAIRIMLGFIENEDKAALREIYDTVQNRSLETIKTALEAKDVFLVDETLERPLLNYLVSFFDHVPVSVEEKIFLHASNQSNPLLFTAAHRQDGLHLIFSPEAGEFNFYRFTTNDDESAEKKKNDDGSEMVLRVQSTNTLFKYLLAHLTNKKILIELMHDLFGVTLVENEGIELQEPSTERKVHLPGGYFKIHELISMLEVLANLPKEITKALSLKGILRLRGSIPQITISSPDDKDKKYQITFSNYVPATEQLLIDDKVFSGSKQQCKMAFTKLIGDVVWNSIPFDTVLGYAKFEWQWNGPIGMKVSRAPSPFWQPTSSRSYGKPDQLKHSPKPFFVKDFSDYMHNSLSLLINHEAIHTFFESEIFGSRRYFNFSSGKARFHVDADTPDTTPPYFRSNGQLDDNMSVEITYPNGQYMELNIEIRNLVDDLSGIDHVILYMVPIVENPHEFGQPLSYVFRPIDATNGIYRITEQIPLKNVHSSTYKIQINTGDRVLPTKNFKIYYSNKAVRLKGLLPFYSRDDLKAPPQKPQRYAYDNKNLQLHDYRGQAVYDIIFRNAPQSMQVDGRETVFSTFIPFKEKPSDLESVDLFFEEDIPADILTPEAAEAQQRFYFSFKVSNRESLTKNQYSPQWVTNEAGDFGLMLYYSFPRQAHRSIACGTLVTLYFPETEKFSNEWLCVVLPKQSLHHSHTLNPGDPDHSLPNFDFSGIEHHIVRSPGSLAAAANGEVTIYVRIPVTGIDHTNDATEGHMRLRNPRGEMIEQSFSRVVQHDGKLYLESAFQFDRYLPDGDYSILEAYIEEGAEINQDHYVDGIELSIPRYYHNSPMAERTTDGFMLHRTLADLEQTGAIYDITIGKRK